MERSNNTMKTTSNQPVLKLQMPCSQWLTLSLMVFGVVERQMNAGRRILEPAEMLTLHKAGGAMGTFMMDQPTYAWHHGYVLLRRSEMEVLLKVIRWYEDTLIRNMEALEAMGERELTDRYEKITLITRAIQNAQPVHPDQYDR
jgi:hypothetical protein